MTSTTISLNDETLAKLKWLKNRYEFIKDGKTLSWEQFFDEVLLDSLYVLAGRLVEKSEKSSNKLTHHDAMALLVGGFYTIGEMFQNAEKEKRFEMR